MGLKSNETAVGYPQDVSATIAPLGMSRRAGHCVSQASQLGRTVDCSSPLAACTAPSGTMKAAPRGGDVQVRSSSIHPSPVSEVPGVFSSDAYLQLLGGNERQQQQLILFWESLGLL